MNLQAALDDQQKTHTDEIGSFVAATNGGYDRMDSFYRSLPRTYTPIKEQFKITWDIYFALVWVAGVVVVLCL